jgi:predicted ABC-type transport system involved in lysophospholipase L1 biosynthesis ATPase subunit
LFGLADESRKTLVIVTHDEHLARRGDRIITIMDGQAV